jgi:hypothetical protein
VLSLDVAEFAAEFGSAVELSEPLDDAELAAEFGLAAELSEPPFGPEGAAIPVLLLAAAPLLGVTSLFGAVPVLELPVVEPMVPEFWANATGAKAATDNAKPAPSK